MNPLDLPQEDPPRALAQMSESNSHQFPDNAPPTGINSHRITITREFTIKVKEEITVDVSPPFREMKTCLEQPRTKFDGISENEEEISEHLETVTASLERASSNLRDASNHLEEASASLGRVSLTLDRANVLLLKSVDQLQSTERNGAAEKKDHEISEITRDVEKVHDQASGHESVEQRLIEEVEQVY